MLNGKEITKEQLQESGLVVNSYFTEKEQLQQYDVKIENIINIKAKA